MEEIPTKDDTDHKGAAASEVVAAEYASSALMTPENMMLPYDYQSFISSDLFFRHMCVEGGSQQFVFSSSSDHQMMMVESEANSSDVRGGGVVVVGSDDVPYDYDYQAAQAVHQIQESDGMEMVAIKCKILNHPLFPRLLRAYVNWQKFASGGGGPLETGFSDEMESWDDDDIFTAFGSDPELDEFMEMYCGILEKHNEDLCNTLSSVTSFISSMEMQLTDLCGALSITSLSDAEEGIIPAQEEATRQLFSTMHPARDGDDDQRSKCNTKGKGKSDLKMNLLSKYDCAQVSSLKLEFSKRAKKKKKKKKGKLPSQARQLLVNWWNSHHSWPYPSEADKVELTAKTGLLPKQVNNWFINQRKRHWRNPSECLRYSWADNNLSAGSELHFADEEREAT